LRRLRSREHGIDLRLDPSNPGAWPGHECGRRPEEPLRDTKLIRRLDVELLVGRVAKSTVVEPAAIVGKSLYHILECGVIGATGMVREGEPDDGQPFTGRWNGALEHFPGKLLRAERRRSGDCSDGDNLKSLS